jgi:glyoxylate reductase
MRVLITQIIDSAGIAQLKAAGLEVDVWSESTPMPREQMLTRLAGCAGLLSMLNDRVDGAVMDAGPLRVVANHAVGVDNIDLAAAGERGVTVTNTPGVLTDATADLTFALLLAVARRLPEAEAYLRGGRFRGWQPTLLRGMDLRGATLGIVGLGRIGKAVAHRARAFGMELIHSSRSGGVSLDELLSRSDVVSLHCPLTPKTRHLIDASALRRMKRTAILINTARGPVVDEAALAQALNQGWIAGAGLDVFEAEPEVNPALLRCPNAILLPHLGSATYGTRERMGQMVAADIIAVLHGQTPNHLVSP